jgi:hypothetical protein
MLLKNLVFKPKDQCVYNFYSGILYEKEVVMFAIKVDLFFTGNYNNTYPY